MHGMTPTLLDRYERWMQLRGLAQNTIGQRLGCLDRMIRATGLEPDAMTARHLAAWQEGWRLSPQSHCTYVSHVQAFYEWAVEIGAVTEDPSRVLVRPRLPRRLPRPIPEDRLLRALTSASGRTRVYLFLAAYAGLRACEIAPLRRDSIHEAADFPVIVVNGKGNKERVIPLAPELWRELAMFGLPTQGCLFGRHGDPSRPVTAGTVSSSANAHLHGIGMSETLHTLRHRFASRCYQISLDIRLTQELLGHSSPATTAGYAAYAPEAASLVVRRLAAVS